jgi:hypothetical protein
MCKNEWVIYILLSVKGKEVSCACLEGIWGSGGVAPLILTSALDRVSGQLHSSAALFLGTETQVPND